MSDTIGVNLVHLIEDSTLTEVAPVIPGTAGADTTTFTLLSPTFSLPFGITHVVTVPTLVYLTLLM